MTPANMPPAAVIEAVAEALRRLQFGIHLAIWREISESTKVLWRIEARDFLDMANELGVVMVQKDDGK